MLLELYGIDASVHYRQERIAKDFQAIVYPVRHGPLRRSMGRLLVYLGHMLQGDTPMMPEHSAAAVH